MEQRYIDIQYRLDFFTAFHMGSGLPNGLVHRGIARNAKGLLYIPGSMIKGVLRDGATQLAQVFNIEVPNPHQPSLKHEFSLHPDIVTLIFGSRFRPGTVFFDDALLCPEDQALFEVDGENRPKLDYFLSKQVETRTQVSLSRLTGTAGRHLLFTTEYGIPALRFHGRIYGDLKGVSTTDEQTTYSFLLLLAALRGVDGIGGHKSAGAGHVCYTIEQCQIDQCQVDVDDYLDSLPDFEYYALAVEEDENH